MTGVTRDLITATLALALLSIASSARAVSAASSETHSDPVPPAQESGVDASIKPGDDFYAYANGDWLKATTIAAGLGRWSARDEIEANTRRQVASLIEEGATQPLGSYQRKVADFYAAYLADGLIEAKGISSIKPLLTRIDGLHDKAALMRLIGSELRADVDPLNFGIYASSHLFGLSVERGIHGEKRHFAYLVQGGLGLPDRDYYLATSPKMQAVRVKYQENIGRVLKLAGFDRAAQRAREVMALETAIARSHGTRAESSEDRNADNRWTRVDFANKAPGMDWRVFFAAAGLSKQNDFVAWQPGAIIGEAALVASQSLEAWKNYLRFHVIDRYTDLLPRSFSIHEGDVSGASKQNTREQRAIDATSKAMPEAVGRMYVEKYFSSESKTKVREIVANVISAFEKRIEAVPWMTPATKIQALSKLKTMYFGVGYPEHWTDYSRLTIDAGDAVGNSRRAADWHYENALIKLDQPTDITEWVTLPQTVGAIYMPLQNAYNFSAALLQAPKFDPTASDAANYGAIGAIAGHEITHFVDSLGANYDADGGMRLWWTNADKAKFEALSVALVTQFSSYRPFSDLSINGKLTLTENIADLGGLAAAFDAYRRTLGRKANDKHYVRILDRQFFIGFARAWRVKIRNDALRTQVTTNDHAPETFRVSTVRNMDAWYDAFDVLPGQRLYLEPKARVRIW
jgi:putative endopeptidase